MYAELASWRIILENRLSVEYSFCPSTYRQVMKPELKRIEQALHIAGQVGSEQTVSPVVAAPSLPSFPDAGEARPQKPEPTPASRASQTVPPASKTLATETSTQTSVETRWLALPQVRAQGFTSHRNAANPALTVNLLKEIQAIVEVWQQELQQLSRQIQNLYQEGPIVDGWLESYTQPEGSAPQFRHAEVDCLMNYLEQEWGAQASASTSETPAQPRPELNSAGYRLCGLNEDGRLWFRHCPPEQVVAVSLAIARYQKLQTLVTKRQQLENRLSQLAETLIQIHFDLT